MNIENLQNKNTDDLFTGILTLKNIDECYAFFCDLCTPNELNNLSQRLQIAKEFRNGENFTNLSKKVNASSATIAKVKKDLIYGNNGLAVVLDRLKEVDKNGKN